MNIFVRDMVRSVEHGLRTKSVNAYDDIHKAGVDGEQHRRWANAHFKTEENRVRVQLGDGTRYTITIEEDLL